MKLLTFCLIFYPLSNSAMELAGAQDQTSRLLVQRGLQDNMRLKASEEQRQALELAVKRERERIVKLEAELNALRAANGAVITSDSSKKSYFSTTLSDNVTRGLALVGVAVISGMAGYWCGTKNVTTNMNQEENKK